MKTIKTNRNNEVVLNKTKKLLKRMCLDSGNSESDNFKSVYDQIRQQDELEIENKELKKSVRELKLFKKNQQQFTENIDAIIWRFDLVNDKWLHVSPQAKKILGYEPQEWTNLQWWIDIMHPDDQIWAPDFCSQHAMKGKHHEFEYRLLRKDGAVIWIYDKVEVELENNKPVALYGVMFDITRQKEIEFQTKEREQRLQSLVKILQFETSTINELLDYTLEEAIKLTKSKFGYIFFYDEDKQEFSVHSWSKDVMNECKIIEKQIRYKLETTGIWGEAVRQRKRIVVNDFEAFHPLKKGTPEGHVKLNNFLSIPVINDSDIVAVIGVGNKEDNFNNSDILDLTLLMESTWKIVQKKNIENLIKIQNRELKEANENKKRLMTILSHDLKNPFNVILGFLQILQKNVYGYDHVKIANQVDTIYKSARSYYELQEQLLVWIRSRTNKTLFNPVELNIKQLSQDVISEMKSYSDNKKIQINLAIKERLKVFADRDMLKTILRNLLSNAIKFTREHGLVSIKAEEKNSFIWIAVSDTGVGMSNELSNNLFASSSNPSLAGTNKEKGTGLGLAICKDFVEKHGGQISVQSESAKGTTIRFSLNAKANE